MKHFILEKVIVYVLNPCLNKNDVIVNFEYEKLDEKEVRFILNAYIGEDHDHYRFSLKMISRIQLQQYYENDHKMIEDVIEILLPYLMNFILFFDDFIHDEKERFS